MDQPYDNTQPDVGFIPRNSLQASVDKYIETSSGGVIRDIYESIPERQRSARTQAKLLKVLHKEFEYPLATLSCFTRAGVYVTRPIDLKNVCLRPDSQEKITIDC